MNNPWKDAMLKPVTKKEVGTAIDARILSVAGTVAHVLAARAKAAQDAENAGVARGIVPFQWRKVAEHNPMPPRLVWFLRPNGTTSHAGVCLSPDAIAWAELPAPPPWATSEPVWEMTTATQPTMKDRIADLEKRIRDAEYRINVLVNAGF